MNHNSVAVDAHGARLGQSSSHPRMRDEFLLWAKAGTNMHTQNMARAASNLSAWRSR